LFNPPKGKSGTKPRAIQTTAQSYIAEAQKTVGIEQVNNLIKAVEALSAAVVALAAK